MTLHHIIKKGVGRHLSNLESALLWRGLRSYIFHVDADSETSPKIKKIKMALSHPGICCSVEELSAGDARHVMEEEFKGMKTDLHSVKIGKRRIPNDHAIYGEEVEELHGSVTRAKKKVFRVKALIDADRIDRSSVVDILCKISELRRL
ncbi:MAG: hypothetical protein WAX07_09170 [Candidatus Altiarchaeia archaeon]